MIVNKIRLPWPLVETDWLANELGAEDLRIIDCGVVMKTTADGGYTFVGGKEEYAQGHIPGGAFVDVLRQLTDSGSSLPMMLPKPETFSAVMSSLGVGTGTRAVLYDRSNHAWAARVWWMLRAYGFEHAAVLNGGWNKWRAEQKHISTDPHNYPAARFTASYQPQLIADKQQVAAAIEDSQICLINALSPAEHTGESTRFARPGRITNSVNVYCQSLVDPQTHAYLPASELREIFASAGALDAQQSITYCGAGIAASSDALILTALGVQNIAVYDGSMAEWTSDADAPMETG